jgi:hypothetical protein
MRKENNRRGEFVDVEVVDGQQRITTLGLLLKALAKNELKYSEEIESLLVKGDDLSLLLLQTNHDITNVFADYLRQGKLPKKDIVRTAADVNLVNAISECEHFVAVASSVNISAVSGDPGAGFVRSADVAGQGPNRGKLT